VCQASTALHDRDLVEQIGLQHERVLLTLEAGQQIAVRHSLGCDTSDHSMIVTRRANDQLQPVARGSRLQRGGSARR
jgi:hypothetical protein